jgi:acyl carrier protein
MTVQTISVDDLVQQVNEHISELGGRATPKATFSDLEVDSLICVEIAVFLGQRYNVRLEEYEVAEAGTFEALSSVIARRQAGGENN